jgi:hypothetical protein
MGKAAQGFFVLIEDQLSCVVTENTSRNVLLLKIYPGGSNPSVHRWRN